jgi:hypothetical protein
VFAGCVQAASPPSAQVTALPSLPVLSEPHAALPKHASATRTTDKTAQKEFFAMRANTTSDASEFRFSTRPTGNATFP